MEDAKLIDFLNVLATRIVFLECQTIAMQRLAEQAGLWTEQQFDAMVAKIVEQMKDVLSPESAEERVAAFLRRFQGPVQ
jgi:hypothetical protein